MAEKTRLVLHPGRISAGVWEAELSGAGKTSPAVEAVHAGRVVEGVTLTPLATAAGRFAVRVPIPGWALNDGVQTFVVRSGDAVLGQFTLIAGQPLDEDIRAEVSLLRAELDLLKRAFQRLVRGG